MFGQGLSVLFDTDGGNGLSISSCAVAIARQNSLLDNGTYGVVRDRNRRGWSARAVTLIKNVLRNNHGTVVDGKSNANLGNYDIMPDAADDQNL